jgi:hypothetical protein
MADPILRSSAPPIISTEAQTNGSENPEPFGTSMEEMVQKAYAEARPTEFKPPSGKPPIVPAPAESRDTLDAGTTDAGKSEAEIKPPARAAQWKEVNEERARLKEENAKFKAGQEKYAKEQEKWKSWETERNEFDSVKKRNDELTRLIKEVALDRLPEFKKHFEDRRNTALAIGQQIVGQEHAETLKKIAQLPDGDFRNQIARGLLDNLDEFQKTELGPVLVDIRKINFERQSALDKPDDHLKLYDQIKERDSKRRAEEFERTFQDTLQKWSNPDNGLALFQKKDGDEAHNAEVAQRVETARNILNLNLSADQLSKAALWSAAAPGLLKNQMALAKENKALKEELESLKAGGPDLKGGTENESTVDDEKQFEGMSMGEIVVAKAKKAGVWQ